METSNITLKENDRQLKELAGKILHAQEEERCRLARELHDDLTQRLAVLAIDAGKLIHRSIISDEKVVAQLSEMQKKLITLSEDVHGISRQLHPSIIEDLGLKDALQAEIDAFSRREEIVVQFTTSNLPSHISFDISICIFRVVQEGLRNVGKHAQAENTEIRLDYQKGVLLLTLKDDGRGFDPKEVRKRPGLGLASMRERIRLINGRLTIHSQPGRGTMVMAEVYLN